MRNKQDINENQCDKCGKIVTEGDLSCPEDEESEWGGLALCDKCHTELEKQKDNHSQ